MADMAIDSIGKIVLVFAVSAIIIGISVTILSTIQTSQYVNAAVSNESVTFSLNNTEYATAKTPIVGVAAVYGDDAHTCTYPAEKYVVTTTGIKLYTNGTLACPNITNGTAHYVDYTYQNQYGTDANVTGSGITGLSTFASWIPTLAIVIVSAVIIGIITKSMI